jgi:hypothetical protein
VLIRAAQEHSSGEIFQVREMKWKRQASSWKIMGDVFGRGYNFALIPLD